ncbi:hypothetical protein HID58_075071, partial [Brassica napus]
VTSSLVLPSSVYNGASESLFFYFFLKRKKFTADGKVWNVYLQADPNNTYLREDSFEDFEELKIIFEQNTATGHKEQYTCKHVISRKSFPIERKLERMHITRKGFARKLQKSKRWVKEAEDKANNI